MPNTKISIRRLKDFAFSHLPQEWALRQILLAESEELDTQSLLARLPIWLKLLEMERSRHAFSGK